MNPNPMPSEPSWEVKFEIGHVLFIDFVGYSKLVINEQCALLHAEPNCSLHGAIPESEPTE
jgi:hypothetical protein